MRVAANFCAQSESSRLQERQPLGDILIKLNEQDRFARFRIELEEIARGLKMQLPFRLIEQGTIDVFDRRWLKIEKLDRGLHRFIDRGEKDQAQTFLAWEQRDFQFRGKNCGERSLTASENFVEIVWRAQKSFEPVAGPAFQQSRRHTLADVGDTRAN